MSDQSILQALRNLWVIHSIQLLLDRDVGLTPATFAYSMLYPWTDNYLDSAEISASSKKDFGVWLESRLSSPNATPPDAHAAQVSRLIAMIETAYPREDFETVYLSLSGIHHAQIKSLRQHRTDDVPDGQSLLTITFEKGGASLLADAYLVAGKLEEAEAEFMFGYGTVLQLLDDLQDVEDDLRHGHTTIFTRGVAGGGLDQVTSHLWSYVLQVIWSAGAFDAPRFHSTQTLIQENCKFLLLQSIARHQDFYTRRFVAQMETASPFRFSYLRDRKATLSDEFSGIITRLRREHPIHSDFDLLN